MSDFAFEFVNDSEKLIEQTGVIGEKIQINDFSRIEANYVGTYFVVFKKFS